MYRSEELLVIAKRMQDAGLLTKGVTREQLIDFAYGNTSIENTKITREIAEKAVDSLGLVPGKFVSLCPDCHGKFDNKTGLTCRTCWGNLLVEAPPSQAA